MAEEIVRRFWATMATNDFDAASLLLSEDFEYYMPQTQEYLKGRASFAGLNRTYPAEGKWLFDLRSVVANQSHVVTEVGVTDGSIHATAVTFHTVRDGQIWRQVEYWPDDYPAPDFRAQWTTRITERPF